MDKNILVKQAEKSVITTLYEEGIITIKFSNLQGDKYPHSVRVPVEMRAFQKEYAPIVFMLHVIEGYLDELEIFSADGSTINADNISLDKLEYVIDPEVSFGN
ncbi:hypothetical protein [Butyrivibrio sp. M55]|uniref:hypothetical protein n=1 Tax=Butyrivibrio sp. M55 TaxID=1855323 RepID=UPI001113B54D|nr:hypothetical protein [Butyrivibrio sp. M55]